MTKLISTKDYLPVPFPNEDVQKIRDWLERVIPLSGCKKYAENIKDVVFECGYDAPDWVWRLASQVAAQRPRPIDIQILCYTAMIQQPIHKAFERIFEQSFDTVEVWRDAPPRFERAMSLHFNWRLERLAPDETEFQADPVAGRLAVSKVKFAIITDVAMF